MVKEYIKIKKERLEMIEADLKKGKTYFTPKEKEVKKWITDNNAVVEAKFLAQLQ